MSTRPEKTWTSEELIKLHQRVGLRDRQANIIDDREQLGDTRKSASRRVMSQKYANIVSQLSRSSA